MTGREFRFAVDQLTPRQRAVFELLLNGKTNKEIAAELGCSERTAQCHASDVLHAFEVLDRRQLLVAARNNCF